MNAASNSPNKFSKKSFRKAYLWDFTRRIIALQMRALRGKKKQREIAAELGIKQSWISKLEDTTYGTVNVRTLLQIASAFDVGLIVRFVPYSEFFEHSKKVFPKDLKVLSYEEEVAELKRQPPKEVGPEKVKGSTGPGLSASPELHLQSIGTQADEEEIMARAGESF